MRPSCADSLEMIASPLHELRVQFHLELAKCEVDQDYLAKANNAASIDALILLIMQASADVKKALLLDYVTPVKATQG